jgi:shikimate dehydrogenase
VLVHLGSPMVHAKVPTMFNAELRRRGLNAVLIPLEVPASGLEVALSALSAAANVDGLLVTMPHKASIVRLCDQVGRESELVGAANAVRFDADRTASCEMFDGLGLVGALDIAGVDLDDADVLLVGCGGAGSAIAGALANRPIRSLTLHNRTHESAELLAERLRSRHSDVRVVGHRPSARGYGVVVNATRLGMQPGDELPVDLSGASACTIADIVTGDHRSPLLCRADAMGLATVAGAEMLRAQMSSILDYWSLGA